MTEDRHHQTEDPARNNPLRTRFDNSVDKPAGQFSRITYVLQGGGALGAYQAVAFTLFSV